MNEKKTSIDIAVEKMVELDAAGWGVIVLRADSEADIRRVVAKYPHLYEPTFKTKGGAKYKYDNIREAIGGGLVKEFFSPLSFPDGPSANGNQINEWLSAALRPSAGGARHRVLYVRDIHDLIGRGNGDGHERTLEQLQILYLLRALCEEKKKGLCHSLVVIGCTDERLCPELAEYAYAIDVGCPDREEMVEIIRQACRECGGIHHGLEIANANELAEISRGMRQDEIKAVVSLAFARDEHPLRDGAAKLFAAAREAKKQRISGVRGLRWIRNDDAAQVGGLGKVREWLLSRKAAFNYTYAAQKFKVSPPKGILLAGLPGCGKTLFAKFASRLLGEGKANRIPVLQMDLTAMLGKYVGDSEGNFARALRTVENIAPCVVIIDEIEKFFGGVSDGNNEVSKHIFASLLDWMQTDREKPVLVIATANKVDKLPPELKRKGRFDETFFVGIPTRKDCRDILSIHLRRKGGFERGGEDVWIRTGSGILRDDFDYDAVVESVLDAAAKHRRFFNGADIESIVNSAFCALFSTVEKNHKDVIENVQRGGGIEASTKYGHECVKNAILDELEHTRSYFDNNMEETASYWVSMKKMNFRNAGGVDLFEGIDYYEDTGTFAFKDFNMEKEADDYLEKYGDKLDSLVDPKTAVSRYDDAFRYLLAQKIFRLTTKKAKERQG